MRPYRLAPLIVSSVALLGPVASVFAHEHRQVGGYEMTVGWVEEPPYAGFRNGVQLLLTDQTGRPFLDLGETLKVEVVYEKEKTEPAMLAPAFGAKFGRPGEYRAPVIPTRPGAYTFRFRGAIKGQHVDESFKASESTFDLVRGPTEIEFPAKDPTRAELALRILRMSDRLDKVHDSLDGIKTIAALGLAVGLAGLIAALVVGRIRRLP